MRLNGGTGDINKTASMEAFFYEKISLDVNPISGTLTRTTLRDACSTASKLDIVLAALKSQ